MAINFYWNIYKSSAQNMNLFTAFKKLQLLKNLCILAVSLQSFKYIKTWLNFANRCDFNWNCHFGKKLWMGVGLHNVGKTKHSKKAWTFDSIYSESSMPSWNTFSNEPMASGAQFLPFFFRQFQNCQKSSQTPTCLFCTFFRDFCFFLWRPFPETFFPFEMKKLFSGLLNYGSGAIFLLQFSPLAPKFKKLCRDQMLKFQHGTGQKISRTSQIPVRLNCNCPQQISKMEAIFSMQIFRDLKLFVGEAQWGKMGGLTQHNFLPVESKNPKTFGSGSIPFNHEPKIAICT